MLNRAAASVYEMGSTFKTYTFAMALDSGVKTMADHFDASQPLVIGSRVIHDYHKGESILSMQEAFIMSSNISTAKMALAAGAERVTDYFQRYGLFAPAKVELAEAARPLTPKKWDESTVASASFGQAISVSPLNMAASVGALMNGGLLHPLTTFGFMTAGWNAAPTAGRVIDRIAPFLSVARVAATPFDPPRDPAAAKPVDEEAVTGPL